MLSRLNFDNHDSGLVALVPLRLGGQSCDHGTMAVCPCSLFVGKIRGIL